MPAYLDLARSRSRRAARPLLVAVMLMAAVLGFAPGGVRPPPAPGRRRRMRRR